MQPTSLAVTSTAPGAGAPDAPAAPALTLAADTRSVRLLAEMRVSREIQMQRMFERIAVLLAFMLVSSSASAASAVDSLRAEVARLDAVDSVYAPLVKELTVRGQPVVPFLLEKLQSPRRLTALSAAWAIGKMGDERNLGPLLENWAKAKNETLKSETMTALSMTMRGLKHRWRTIPLGDVSADVQLLLDARLCPESDADGRTRYTDGENGQPLLFGDQLGEGYRVSCFQAPVEIFQSRYPDDGTPEELHGRRFISFHCDILDIAEPSVAMHEWEKLMGGRPSSLAFVFTWSDRVWPPGVGGLSGSGQETLWAKCAGTWRRIGVTQAMIS